MNMPGFTGESTFYRTKNQYRATASGIFLDDSNATVTPQGCGWAKGITCGAVIAGGVVVCTASCLAGPATGGIPCYLCWSGYLGALYGFCRDCIPGWMRDLIDLAEGGGGGGSGGGGGGGDPLSHLRCCGLNKLCKCGGRCVTNSDGTRSCVGGRCLNILQQCP